MQVVWRFKNCAPRLASLPQSPSRSPMMKKITHLNKDD